MIDDGVIKLIKKHAKSFNSKNVIQVEENKKLKKIIKKYEAGDYLTCKDYLVLDDALEKIWIENNDSHTRRQFLIETTRDQFEIYKDVVE